MKPWKKLLWSALFLGVGGLGITIGLFLGSSRILPDKPIERSSEEKRAYGTPLARGKDVSVIPLTTEQKQTLKLKIEPAEQRIPEEKLAVTGKITANLDRAVVIGPRTSGRVVKVLSRLGEMVDTGAPLALLDSVEVSDAFADLAQSESGLSLAQARLEKERQIYEAKLQVLETVRREEDASAAEKALAKVELGRPKQEYISALAKLELARANYDRQKLLVESKIGARKDLIEAEKALIGARGEVDAVAETIRLTLRQELLAAETSFQQALVQRDKAREKLRLLGINESNSINSRKQNAGEPILTPLIAPFRGTVIERQVTVGQLLEPGFVAFRLADLSTVWVLLDVPETALTTLRIGQEVAIETTGEKAKERTGKVAYIGDVVDEGSRTVKVRVELLNGERQFKPGMFVTARITTRRTGEPTIMVPPGALFIFDEGPVIFVEGAEGIQARSVEVGQQVGSWIPVRKGLKAGEKIVTEGGFALKAHLLKSKLGEE